MTDQDKAEWLIRIVREMQSTAERASVKARAELAGRETAAQVWADANPDDGLGMGSNPFRQRASDLAEVKRLGERAANTSELADFTVQRVLAAFATPKQGEG